MPWAKYFRRARSRSGTRTGLGRRPVSDSLERRLMLVAAGDLDPSFGEGGRAVFSGLGGSGVGSAVVVQSDGSLLVPAVGSDNFDGHLTLTKLTPGGKIDASFGSGGTATTPISSDFTSADGLEVLFDGRPVLFGLASFFSSITVTRGVIARYTPGGQPDPTFGGTDGVADVPTTLTRPEAFAVDASGRSIVAGQVDSDSNTIGLVRLTASGDPDDGPGLVTVDVGGFVNVRQILVQPDGNILVLASAGGVAKVVRLNGDTLAPDPTFGVGGVATGPSGFLSFASGFALQPDGSIVVRRGNDSDGPFDAGLLIRFDAGGDLDTNFGNAGVVSTPFSGDDRGGGSIAVDPSGAIVTVDALRIIGSGSQDVRVARFDRNGVLDTDFGSAGTVAVDFTTSGGADIPTAVAFDDARRIVVLGEISTSGAVPLAVARLFTDETPPTVSITPPIITAGTEFTDFQVLYTDDVGVDLDSVDSGDLRVLGPRQVGALGVELMSTSDDAGTVTAVWRVSAPGGSWDLADNGTYTITTPAGISDRSGNVNSPVTATFDPGVAPPDTQPPAATLDAGPAPVAGAATYEFNVSYTDNVGIAAGAGNDNQVVVTGPNGFTEFATFVSVAGGSGGNATLRYRINAPGGAFDVPDNGTYAVSSTGPSAVTDTSGNRVPDGAVGSFEVAVGVGATPGPSAAYVDDQRLPDVGEATYDFAVTYTDPDTVNAASIDGADIVVTGPNAFSAQASLVSGNLTNATSLTATYRVSAPGGTFDQNDDGTYIVSLLPGAVADVDGVPAPAGSVGTFQLAFSVPAGELDPNFGGGDGVAIFDPPGPGLKTVGVLSLDDGSTVAAAFTDVAVGSADVTLFRTTAAGALDPTFGGSNNGLVSLNVGADDRASSIVRLADGKFLVAGTTSTYDGGGVETDADFFVARFNSNGTVDTTFGTGGSGFVTADFGPASFDRANDLVVLDDGRIILFGSSTAADPDGDFALARFSAAGVFDASFGTGGRVLTDLGGADVANAVTVGAGGRLVAAGSTSGGATGSFAVVGYSSDGVVDATFGGANTGSILIDFRPGLDEARTIARQADGKLVVGGFATSGDPDDAGFDSDFALARLNTDGTLDASFAGGGKTLADFGGPASISSVVVVPGGKIVASGQVVSSLGAVGVDPVRVAVARFNADGSLDANFSADGKLIIDFGAVGGTSLGAFESFDVEAAADGELTDLEQKFEQFRQELQGLISVTQGGAILALATQGSNVEFARVIGDGGAPSLFVALKNVSEIDVASVLLVVRLVDDLAVDASSLGAGDLRVTGPNGFDQLAEFVEIVGGGTDAAPEITARYRLLAPGGEFLKANDGTYTLAVEPSQIGDVNGNFLQSGAIPSGTFTVAIPENLANLRVDGGLTGTFPPSVVGGSKAKGGSVRVTNDGDLDAKTTVAVTIYASTDAELDEAVDTSVAAINGVKLSLKPGKSKALKLKFTQYPSALDDGDYFLIARIDSGGALAELKESDNVAPTAAKITIAAPFIDLSATPGPTKGALAPGAKATASAIVLNSGNVPAKASVPVTLVASPGDQTIGNGDVALPGATLKLNLKPGASKASKVPVTVPISGLAPGNYFLVAVLGPASGLTEKDATNNGVVLGQFTVT